MYTRQPKKLLIMNILDILRKYSDEEHRLNQKEIADRLRNEYDMPVDRKAVRRNILNLMDCGYEIEYTEKKRMVPLRDAGTGEPVLDEATGKPRMEENEIWTDFLSEAEIYGRRAEAADRQPAVFQAYSRKTVPDLIRKLEDLSNVYFRSRVKHISCEPSGYSDNRQLFWNIERLDEAISKKKKVSFFYMEYGTDKKLHPKKRADGQPREYLVNPYQMAAREGKYYLICNYEKYDTVSNYRIDRILI